MLTALNKHCHYYFALIGSQLFYCSNDEYMEWALFSLPMLHHEPPRADSLGEEHASKVIAVWLLIFNMDFLLASHAWLNYGNGLLDPITQQWLSCGYNINRFPHSLWFGLSQPIVNKIKGVWYEWVFTRLDIELSFFLAENSYRELSWMVATPDGPQFLVGSLRDQFLNPYFY